jgi:hypothetical protein
MYWTQVGLGLTYKHQTKLEMLASEKNSRLIQKFVNYGRKKFCSIDP